jgi:hypothetical protein
MSGNVYDELEERQPFSVEIYRSPNDAVKKRPTTRESRSLPVEPAAFFGEKEFPGLTSRPGRPRILLETKGFS